MEASKGKVRADVAHDKLHALGYNGSERTTRRAVAAAKKTYRAGRRRVYRPWVPEPGMWFQFDWCDGPNVAGERTWLFCAWLAWCRFRVVIPVTDKTTPTLISCIETMPAPLRRGADVRAHRQRGDRDDRHRRPHPGPPSRDGRHGPPLRARRRHMCGGRPRVEGRFGGDGPHRRGRPRPDRRQPAGRLHELLRAFGLRRVLRAGERP